LQLIDDVAAGTNSHRDGRDETAASHDDVKNVPPVGTETSPAESVEAHMDVHHVHDGDKEEKIIYTHSIRKQKRLREVSEKLTPEVISHALS
jgi:hypothetical protein